MKSLLKYSGGKMWAAKLFGDELACYLNRNKGTYIEPFVGGGSMFFHVNGPDYTQAPYGRKVLNDTVPALMNFYDVLAQSPDGLAYSLAALRAHGVDKEAYLRIRAVHADTAVMEAARFLYLNRAGFNGLYRENADGEFNVPYGYGDASFPKLDAIHEASSVLGNVELFCGDFEPIIAQAGEHDLVYVDPPYAPLPNKKGFVNYAKGGFSAADQERLAAALYHASERGAAIVAHNNDTELVRYLYGEWCTLTPVFERRAGNSAVGKRSERAPCLVITQGIDLALDLHGSTLDPRKELEVALPNPEGLSEPRAV
jgi:DNA adenine methylase